MFLRSLHRRGVRGSAALVVASCVVGACGGSRPHVAGKPTGNSKRATTTTTVGPNGVAATKNEVGIKSVQAAAESTKRFQAAVKKGDIKDGIIGGPDVEETLGFRPKGCPMIPEQTCYIDWRGQYQLVSRPEASILFGVYENDETTPSFSATLKGARPPGNQFFDRHFFYKVRATTTKAVFRVSLIATDGTVLATGADYIFKRAG